MSVSATLKKTSKYLFTISSGTYLAYTTYFYFQKSDIIKIDYHHNKLKEIVELNKSFEHKIYNPSLFFNNGHIQSVLILVMNRLDKIFSKAKKKHYSKTRKLLKTKDGENIYLDFFVKAFDFDPNFENFENMEFLSKFNDSNILIIIPGACGSSGEFYLTDVMDRFINENFKCVAVNHRGILKYPLKSNKLYHSGYTDDLHEVLKFLNTNIKGSKFFLLGFSMGGNITMKFIGESGEKAKTDYNIFGACAVGGPLDLKIFKEFSEPNNKNSFYSKYICKNLISVFNKNKSFLTANMETKERLEFIAKIQGSVTPSDYYENYVFKAFNYKSMEEYHQNASGTSYINNIKVPFLCIMAEDDPICPLTCITEHPEYKDNENFILATTKSGGHVGFFKGLSFKRWIHEPIIEFIRDLSHKKL